MIDVLNPIIFIATAALLLAIILYALRSKPLIVATLAEKLQLQDQCSILTFLLPKNKNRLDLKIGQQIIIKTKANFKGRQFTPIQETIGSFKILLIPNLDAHNQEESKLNQELSSMKQGQKIFLKIVKNNFSYIGNSEIRIKYPGKKQSFVKKFENIYVLAQGSKIPSAYQIIKGICESKNSSLKAQITVLFVGGGIGDFALKKQFQNLEQDNSNIKYFYSLPVKGQRQPSIAGMGISSEKVSETFETPVKQTFCILCAEQSDICVTAERSLLGKGVPVEHIFKY